MKKMLCLLMLGVLLGLSGCANPDSLQLDLSQGYGEHLRLLHINASSQEKQDRIQGFTQAIREADPLDKELSLFAYYPDFQLEISPWENGENLTVIVDINGDYVDFFYPGPYPEQSNTIYRSHMSAQEFKVLVHQA